MVVSVTPPLPHTDGECDGAVARVTESERSGEWQTNQDIQTAQPHFKVRGYTVFIISVSSVYTIIAMCLIIITTIRL